MGDIGKRYYKIREVAELLDLPLSTLRYWEKRFTIIKPRRNEGGRRLYTPSDLEKIRMVAYLVRDRGLHLEAAEEQIRHNHSGVSRKAHAVDRLRAIREELQRMLDALNSKR